MIRLERELERIGEREGARVRDLDLLHFELDEIVEAQPDAGEEDELATERDRLRHAESLRAAAAEALAAVSGDGDAGGAAEAMGSAEAALGAREGVDPALDRLAETARGLRVELQELAAELRAYAEGIEGEPGRLEQVEERLEVLDRLKRKHGGSIESVLAHAEHCRAEIDGIEGAGETTERLEAEHAEAMRLRTDLAGGLSEIRAKSAKRLEARIAEELDQLAMSGAKLEISLEPHPDGFGRARPGTGHLPGRNQSGDADLAAARRRLGRRALPSDARPRGPGSAGRGGDLRLRRDRRRRSAARPPRRWGSGCERSAKSGRSSASPICRRSPRWRRATSGSRRRVDGGQATATVEQVDGDELVAEIVRMLGGARRRRGRRSARPRAAQGGLIHRFRSGPLSVTA